MSPHYLTDLNKEQRRAVEHGVDRESATKAPPLLVIAGAGSGKTKTLAHRVAHLVVSGVDPHRILMLTFTRRAAEEMIWRVKRITAKALGTQQIDLPWSGTFHAIGARLLREYASLIGLKPSFTILDRSDATDLMDLVRHDLGQSKKPSRFPKKDTCLSIYSLTINSGKLLEQVLAQNFPWCAEWEKELRRLFQSYTAAKQRQNVLYPASAGLPTGIAERIVVNLKNDSELRIIYADIILSNNKTKNQDVVRAYAIRPIDPRTVGRLEADTNTGAKDFASEWSWGFGAVYGVPR